MAGIMEAGKGADIVITMDADLQDDIDAVDLMLKEYENGAEVVWRQKKQKKG